MLMDNSPIHRGKPIRLLCSHFRGPHVHYFPAYTLELNPYEGVWGYLKGRLANGRPDNLEQLQRDLQREFKKLSSSQRRLRGCIRQSELSNFLP